MESSADSRKSLDDDLFDEFIVAPSPLEENMLLQNIQTEVANRYQNKKKKTAAFVDQEKMSGHDDHHQKKESINNDNNGGDPNQTPVMLFGVNLRQRPEDPSSSTEKRRGRVAAEFDFFDQKMGGDDYDQKKESIDNINGGDQIFQTPVMLFGVNLGRRPEDPSSSSIEKWRGRKVAEFDFFDEEKKGPTLIHHLPPLNAPLKEIIFPQLFPPSQQFDNGKPKESCDSEVDEECSFGDHELKRCGINDGDRRKRKRSLASDDDSLISTRIKGIRFIGVNISVDSSSATGSSTDHNHSQEEEEEEERESEEEVTCK